MGKPTLKFESEGDWKRTIKFLDFLTHMKIDRALDYYGQLGVDILSQYTPVDTGKAAKSWYYTAYHGKDKAMITYRNSDVEDGCNVVILLHYGHSTKSGSFVKGLDFVNPAVEPVFNDMARKLWREITES